MTNLVTYIVIFSFRDDSPEKRILFLDRFFSSLFNQTSDQYDLIIIDNHLDDYGREKLNEYVKKLDNVTLYKEEEKKFGTLLRVKYAQKAKTPYVTFLDDDDSISSGAVESMNKAIIENPDADMIIPNIWYSSSGWESNLLWERNDILLSNQEERNFRFLFFINLLHLRVIKKELIDDFIPDQLEQIFFFDDFYLLSKIYIQSKIKHQPLTIIHNPNATYYYDNRISSSYRKRNLPTILNNWKTVIEVFLNLKPNISKTEQNIYKYVFNEKKLAHMYLFTLYPKIPLLKRLKLNLLLIIPSIKHYFSLRKIEGGSPFFTFFYESIKYTFRKQYWWVKKKKDKVAQKILRAEIFIFRLFFRQKKNVFLFIMFDTNSLAMFHYLKKDPSFVKIYLSKEIDNYKYIFEKSVNAYPIKQLGIFSFKKIKQVVQAKYVFTGHHYATKDIKKIILPKVIIQLYHGIPLKTIGSFVPNTLDSLHSPKNLAGFGDYVVVSSKWQQIFYSAAMHIYPLNVPILGNPRHDIILSSSDADLGEGEAIFKRSIQKYKKDKKIIFYTPSWRDANKMWIPLEELLELEKVVQDSGYIFAYRFHHLSKNSILGHEFNKFYKLSSGLNLNSLKDIHFLFKDIDILISDYSSIIHDFSLLKRPIIKYLCDIDKYSRGFFVNPSDEKVPGVSCYQKDQLYDIIKNMDQYFDDIQKQKDQKALDYNIQYKDTNNAKRIMEYVQKIL